MFRVTALVLLWIVLTAPVVMAQNEQCRKTIANPLNGGACHTISSTVVTVLEANTSRCSLLIYNNSANDMMCRDASYDGTPSATAGNVVPGGRSLSLGPESQGRWQCIRAFAADAVACVTEGRP